MNSDLEFFPQISRLQTTYKNQNVARRKEINFYETIYVKSDNYTFSHCSIFAYNQYPSRHCIRCIFILFLISIPSHLSDAVGEISIYLFCCRFIPFLNYVSCLFFYCCLFIRIIHRFLARRSFLKFHFSWTTSKCQSGNICLLNGRAWLLSTEMFTCRPS